LTKLTQRKDRELKKEQREIKLLSIIRKKPGIYKREIQTIASNKSKPDHMNPNTTSDYLEKLEIDRKIIVERLSSGNKHYLTADYHTHEELDTMFKEKNTEIKNNLEKSIKSAQIKFNKVNDLGKQKILTYLAQINSFITQEIELGPICYDSEDSRFNDEYIKKFKKFCKKYPKPASLKILKDSENKYKQFKKCSMKIKDFPSGAILNSTIPTPSYSSERIKRVENSASRGSTATLFL